MTHHSCWIHYSGHWWHQWITSPIYRTRSIIVLDRSKNRQVLTLIEPAKLPRSIFIYSPPSASPSVSQHQPCPSILLTLCCSLSLLHPFITSQSSKSVVNGGFESEFESWSTVLITVDLAFHLPQHTSGLNERGNTSKKVSTSFISSLLYIFWPISSFLSPHAPKLTATWPLPSNEGCRPPNVDVNGSWDGLVCWE